MNEQIGVGSIDPTSVDELENRLQARLSGRICGLRIFVYESGIVLRGFAHSYHAEQIAQHIIVGETTVPILANDSKLVDTAATEPAERRLRASAWGSGLGVS